MDVLPDKEKNKVFSGYLNRLHALVFLPILLFAAACLPGKSAVVTEMAQPTTVLPTEIVTLPPSTPPAPALITPTLTIGASSQTAPVAPTDSVEKQEVIFAETGLHFLIPGDWTQKDQGLSWQIKEPAVGWFGVHWHERLPGHEMESILPANSVVQDRTPGWIELEWGQAAIYHLQVMKPDGQGEVLAEETHCIVLTQDRYFDFYVGAERKADLEKIEILLEEVVKSVSQ